MRFHCINLFNSNSCQISSSFIAYRNDDVVVSHIYLHVCIMVRYIELMIYIHMPDMCVTDNTTVLHANHESAHQSDDIFLTCTLHN